jgi:hypothetical protein
LTLRGIVTPVDWDLDGKVRSVAILTRDEGEYQVAPGGVGDTLLSQLRREILAQAVVLEAPSDVKRVSVSSFAILEWNEPDGEVVTTLRAAESFE